MNFSRVSFEFLGTKVLPAAHEVKGWPAPEARSLREKLLVA
jgi:hypothetical protein